MFLSILTNHFLTDHHTTTPNGELRILTSLNKQVAESVLKLIKCHHGTASQLIVEAAGDFQILGVCTDMLQKEASCTK
jgi:hypothetical protein